MNINISGSNINGSPIIAGNNNSTITSKTNAEQSPSFDWERLQNDLEVAIHRLPTNSKEYIAAKKILHSVEQRDKPTLLSQVKHFAPQLASQLFISVASEFLSKFISSIF